MNNILESVIPIGKSNAIHQENLAHRLGVTKGTAKKMVREARNHKMPILSSTCGYWIAENDIEKKEFALLMNKQAETRLKTASCIKDTIGDENSKMGGSEALEDNKE